MSAEIKKELVDMNVRGLDPILYREFKSAVYKAGYNNIKKCMEDLLVQFIVKTNNPIPSEPNGLSDSHNADTIG